MHIYIYIYFHALITLSNGLNNDVYRALMDTVLERILQNGPKGKMCLIVKSQRLYTYVHAIVQNMMYIT